jgi:DNA-binding transcriptional ArsR family regulator
VGAFGYLSVLFALTQSAFSLHHTGRRDAGLVRPRKEGRQRLYSLDARPLRDVFDWAAHYERFWTRKLDALGAVLDREARRARKRGRA